MVAPVAAILAFLAGFGFLQSLTGWFSNILIVLLFAVVGYVMLSRGASAYTYQGGLFSVVMVILGIISMGFAIYTLDPGFYEQFGMSIAYDMVEYTPSSRNLMSPVHFNDTSFADISQYGQWFLVAIVLFALYTERKGINRWLSKVGI